MYSMLSDAAVSINAELVLLWAVEVHWPASRLNSKLCRQQTGTYYDSMGVRTRAGDVKLRMEAGDLDVRNTQCRCTPPATTITSGAALLNPSTPPLSALS